jgi:hypothetical protein
MISKSENKVYANMVAPGTYHIQWAHMIESSRDWHYWKVLDM